MSYIATLNKRCGDDDPKKQETLIVREVIDALNVFPFGLPEVTVII